jgi:hypothetical protein
MLQAANGLPAAPADVPDKYPIEITWSGVMVDDEGSASDIVRCVRNEFRAIFGEKADLVEEQGVPH